MENLTSTSVFVISHLDQCVKKIRDLIQTPCVLRALYSVVCANHFCSPELAAVLLGAVLIFLSLSVFPQEKNSMAMLSKFLLQLEGLNS